MVLVLGGSVCCSAPCGLGFGLSEGWASLYSKEAYSSHGLGAAIGKVIRVHRTKKTSKKCLKWDISLKGTHFGGFRTISRLGDLGSFFGLLCWDRGSNTLL